MKKTKTANVLKLTDHDKKVLLIYVFNGSCKTNLSNQYGYIAVARNVRDEETKQKRKKFLYYDSFIKDSFYSDNALRVFSKSELIFRPNRFTNWVFKDQGKGFDINMSFHRYTIETITFFRFRYLYEKLANFLGYRRWVELTVNFTKCIYSFINKIICLIRHRPLSTIQVTGSSKQDKQIVKRLKYNLSSNGYLQGDIA